MVTTDSLLSQCKLQLQRIERKPFEELPTVRRFLEKVKVDDDGKSKFQDVVLKNFDRRKESARNLKSTWASVISKTIQLRLEDGNDSVVSKYLVHVLKTEGWFRYEKDSEFISKGIEELFEFYKLPLQTAGNHASATEFLLEFHDMVSYALKYFDLSNTDYCVVWHRLFESCRRDEWKSILLLVKLLFTLPVSNAKVKRLFSFMNRIKTDSRNSLSQQQLSSILRICMEGPTSQEFDPKPAMQLWSDGVGACQPNQSQRKKYK